MVEIKIDQEDFNKKLKKALEGIKLDIVNALQDMLHDGVDPTGETGFKGRGLFTGALKASIASNSRIVDNEIEIGMAEYGKYLEFGMPHTVDDVEQLKEWVRLKLFQGKNVKESTINKATETIRKNIQSQGPRPFPFIRTVFENKLTPIINDNLKKAFR